MIEFILIICLGTQIKMKYRKADVLVSFQHKNYKFALCIRQGHTGYMLQVNCI